MKDNLAVKLGEHGFSKDKQTLVIAEGITMYLTEADNHKLLDQLFGLLNDNDELLIGFRTMIDSPTPKGNTIIGSANEHFQFVIQPQDLPAFALPHQFDVTGKMLC